MADGLRGLLQDTDINRPNWTESDFAGLLKHQLDSPLKDDLCTFFADAGDLIKKEKGTTFGHLLRSNSPSLPLLRMVRHFAKKIGTRKDLNYPVEVAKVLYLAAIAAAEVRMQTHISTLSAEEKISGYRWASLQHWITPELVALFERASCI